jgi:hypothetical protein
MTHTQQTKIAEILITKLNAAHNQEFEEILQPTVLQNQIQQKMMVLAGLVVEMLKDAYTKGWQDGFRNGKCRGDGNYSRPNRAEFALEDFDNYINNITCTTHESK